MNPKPSAGALIQIELLKNSLQLPKWESSGKRGMSIVGGYWDQQGEEREIQKVKDRIAEHQDYLLQANKDVFYAAKAQLSKKGGLKIGVQYGPHLITIGSLAVLGFEKLLLDPQIMDEQFIQDIAGLIQEGESREEGAFALLGLEIAYQNGRFIPPILEVFEETLSLRLARHLGKISWDTRVVDSLARATAANFLTTEMDGLSLKSSDGVGLLSALSLLELQDQGGLKAMVSNLLRLKDAQVPDQLLKYAGAAAVPGLIEGLREENVNNSQSRAAKLLGDIGDARAVQPLVQALGSETDLCAIAAAKALGKLGDPEAIPGLLGLLGHKSLLVRSAGSSGLKSLKAVWEPAHFIPALSAENEAALLFAIEACGELKCKEAQEPLSRLASSDDKKVRKAAEKALKRIV